MSLAGRSLLLSPRQPSLSLGRRSNQPVVRGRGVVRDQRRKFETILQHYCFNRPAAELVLCHVIENVGIIETWHHSSPRANAICFCLLWDLGCVLIRVRAEGLGAVFISWYIFFFNSSLHHEYWRQPSFVALNRICRGNMILLIVSPRCSPCRLNFHT